MAASDALINAPIFGESPVNTSSPSPAPARLPALKARPPNTINIVSSFPAPGIMVSASSCARSELADKIRHIFN